MMEVSVMQSASVNGELVHVQAHNGDETLVVYPLRASIPVFRNRLNHMTDRTVSDWAWVPTSSVIVSDENAI